jgi:uncharacterized protein (DUF697 family)
MREHLAKLRATKLIWVKQRDGTYTAWYKGHRYKVRGGLGMYDVYQGDRFLGSFFGWPSTWRDAAALRRTTAPPGTATRATTPDEQADQAIATMVGAVIGTAAIPTYVNWAFTATAMGSGVVAIGLCYGVRLTMDEAWHLIRQFVVAAGFWFAGMILGARMVSAVKASTGIGYVGAVAIDATVSAALAYAIGGAAKAYFKGVRDKKRLGEIVRSRFTASRKGLVAQRKTGAS